VPALVFLTRCICESGGHGAKDLRFAPGWNAALVLSSSASIREFTDAKSKDPYTRIQLDLRPVFPRKSIP